MRNNIVIIAVVSAVVLAAIIYGFTVAGFPVDVRGKAFDATRESNIRDLKYQIDSYTQSNYSLPRALGELTAKSQYSYLKLNDPETNQPYEYRIDGTYSYSLCATFSTAKTKDTSVTYEAYDQPAFNHGKGYTCFNFTVSGVYAPTPYVYPTAKPYYFPTPMPSPYLDYPVDSTVVTPTPTPYYILQ